MKQPKWWYGFKVNCDMYESGMSNMSPMSAQQYCMRDKSRTIYTIPLHCNFNNCPKFKLLRKKIKLEDKEVIGITELNNYSNGKEINKWVETIKVKEKIND